MRDRAVPVDSIDILEQRRKKDKREFKRFINQPPTVPVYEPDFPTDAVNGQFALQDGVPWYFWDGEWRLFGSSGPWQTMLEFPLLSVYTPGERADIETGGAAFNYYDTLAAIAAGEPDPADDTYPFNWYMSNVGLNTANHGWNVPVGPAQSLWEIDGVSEVGDTFGKLTLSMSGPYTEPIAPVVAALHPWVDVITLDMYNAVNYPTYTPGRFEPMGTFAAGSYTSFQIGGADGDELTAISTHPMTASIGVLNGGAGNYYCNFRVNGKNASSTGYDMRLSRLALVRSLG